MKLGVTLFAVLDPSVNGNGRCFQDGVQESPGVSRKFRGKKIIWMINIYFESMFYNLFWSLYMATDYFLNMSLQHNRLLFFSNVCVCVCVCVCVYIYILAHILHIYIMYILGGGDTCPISLVNSTAELIGVDVCSMSILLYTFLWMICSHIYISSNFGHWHQNVENPWH